MPTDRATRAEQEFEEFARRARRRSSTALRGCCAVTGTRRRTWSRRPWPSSTSGGGDRSAPGSTTPRRTRRPTLTRTFLSATPPSQQRRAAVRRAARLARRRRDRGGRRAARAARRPGRLSPADRAVLVLRYLDDLSVDEVAGRMGLSPGAVRNRSLRALERIRGRGRPVTRPPEGIHDEHPDAPDRQLVTLLRDSTADLEPDVAELVAGGVARGRTTRRRRRRRHQRSRRPPPWAASSASRRPLPPGSATPAPRTGRPWLPTRARRTRTRLRRTRRPGQHPSSTPISRSLLPTCRPRSARCSRAGEAGPVLREHPYPVVDEPHERIAHFLCDGTLTTFIIEPASALGTCGGGRGVQGGPGPMRGGGRTGTLT